MSDVYLAGKEGMPFIHTGQLDLKIDLRSALRGEIDFRHIKLKSGTIYLIEDAEHGYNYPIFGSAKEGKRDALNLLLRKIELSDMVFLLDLKEKKQRYKTYIPHLLISGHLTDQVLSLNAHGEMVADYLKIEDRAWFENEEIAFQLELKYFTEDEKMEIKLPIIRAAKIEAGGTLQYDGKKNSLNSNLQSKTFNLAALIKTLPRDLSRNEFLSSMNGKGKLSLNYSQLEQQQLIKVELMLSEGFYKAQTQSLFMRDIQGIFSYTSESKKASLFEIVDFTASVDGQKMEVNGQLIDWGRVGMNFILNGKIPLLPLYQLTKDEENPTWELSAGLLKAENLIWNSSNPEGEELQIIELSGVLFPEKIQLKLAGEKFILDGGKLELSKDFSGQISALNIEGNSSHITLGLLTENFNSLFKGQINNNAQLMLAADSIRLEHWIAFYNHWTSLQKTNENPEKLDDRDPFLMDIQVVAENLHYEKTHYKNLNAYLGLRGNGLIFKLEGTHAEGHLAADGHYSFGKHPFLSFRLNAVGMNLPTVFEEWNDFDQDFIQSTHLQGKLQGHLLGKIFWDHLGQYDPIQSEIIAAFEFHDGELNNFPLLQSFSNYLRAEELSNIRFDRVNNVIWMRDGTFYLPSMFVSSNAVNLTVSGAHTLDHRIRYGIRLNAAQVLGRRLLSRNPSFSPLPARRSDFLNLHFLLAGSIEEFDYRNSVSEVTSLFNQTESIRNKALTELQNAFGELPYFEELEFSDEIPELPVPDIHKEIEYLPGFEF